MNHLPSLKLLLWGIFLYLIVTNSVLSVLGYGALIEANPIFKMGIGTIFILTTFAFYYKKLRIRTPEKNMFLLIAIMLFINMVIKGEYQITNYVTAIIFPVCLSCLLTNYNDSLTKHKIQKIVLLFFYIECGLSILERVLMFHLFGNAASGDETATTLESYEFRSNALWGHPLTNSALTTFLLPFILLNEEYSIKKRNLLWSLGMLSLLCFNSRMAIVCSATIYILINFKSIIHSRYKAQILLGISIITVSFFYTLFYTSLGGRLLDLGLYGSDSSSLARTEILEIFSCINLKDFIFIGIPYSEIDMIQHKAGLDYLIIENPWIIFIFRYGILQTIAMFLFFIPIFKKWLNPYGNYHAIIIAIFFIMIISSSNSLAVGSTSIAQLFLFAYTFSNSQT